MFLTDTSVKRPVLASVVSLLLVAFGLLSYRQLPLREYPDIDPPVVSIETNYRGAAAAVIETRITEPLEQSIAGVEGIDSCVTDGTYKKFVSAMTDKTPVAPGASGIGTPTIAVNGEVISNSTIPAKGQFKTLFQ